MREAIFESLDVVINVSEFWDVKLWVRGVAVDDETHAVLSSVSMKKMGPPLPSMPRIVLTGSLIMSNLTVRSHQITLADRINGNFDVPNRTLHRPPSAGSRCPARYAPLATQLGDRLDDFTLIVCVPLFIFTELWIALAALAGCLALLVWRVIGRGRWPRAWGYAERDTVPLHQVGYLVP